MTEYYVSGCIDKDGNCEVCADDAAQFWTLYERCDDGLSQGIIDCTFRDDAEAAMRVYQERDALQQQVDALAAEGCEFFAYSSEHGYETYSTAAEARKAAEDMIPDFLVDGWDEEVNTVSWGQVVGSAVMVNKHPAPKGSEFDFICDYVIKDSKLADLRQHVK